MKSLSLLAALSVAVVLPAESVAQTKPTPAPAAASAPAPICAAAATRLDLIQRDLSSLRVDEIGDDSAPRATMRGAQTTALYAEAQVLLTQMSQSKCSPYPEVIGNIRYLNGALACNLAKRNFKSGDKLEECDTSKWEAK